MQLIDCNRYHAKITPAACAAYQAKDAVNCKGCVSSAPVQPEVDKVKAGRPQTFNPETTKHKIAGCKQCGRVMPLPGRGLCPRCYGRVLKAEKEGTNVETSQQQAKASAPAPAPAKSEYAKILKQIDHDVWIDVLFIGEDEIKRSILDLAKQSRRDPRQQILFMIEQALPAFPGAGR